MNCKKAKNPPVACKEVANSRNWDSTFPSRRLRRKKSYNQCHYKHAQYSTNARCDLLLRHQFTHKFSPCKGNLTLRVSSQLTNSSESHPSKHTSTMTHALRRPPPPTSSCAISSNPGSKIRSSRGGSRSPRRKSERAQGHWRDTHLLRHTFTQHRPRDRPFFPRLRTLQTNRSFNLATSSFLPPSLFPPGSPFPRLL